VVLRAATRAQLAQLVTGTLVDRQADAVLLVGPAALRARAAERWTAAGRRIVADELAALGPDGVVTGGAAIGFERELHEHWRALPVGKPPPSVDLRGRFVDHHLVPRDRLSDARARTVAAVVVLEDGAAIARTEALLAIARYAPRWLWSPRPQDAGALVALIRGARCSRALEPSPEVLAAA
jgi:hypothetical protein